jgi:DNA repair protein RecO (recombination protein O)
MPSRERSFRVEAIVLHHRDWGEADRFLRLYTLEMGKISAIAKGARKARSRKAGHLEPFTQVSLQLAKGRDLFIVTQAETVDTFLTVRENFLLTNFAAYVVEVVDRFTYDEEENRRVYRLLADTLTRLCTAVNPDLVVRYFELRLLDLIGFRPQLFECASCGKEIKAEDQFFSAEMGGVLCPSCGPKSPGSRTVGMSALKYLRHFQRSNYRDASLAQLTATLNREMEALMNHYLTYLLERGLNTPAFLRRARKDLQQADADLHDLDESD